MRYRKSIKICKGVRVNFSKSGPSVTVGGRGCSVNFGKKGTYLNTGIPGTGFYDRKKIGGGTSSKKTNNNTYNQKKNFTIHYAGDASIVIKDEMDRVVTDASLLRKIKSTPEYKQELDRMSQLRLDEFNEKIEQFVGIYKDSCEVLSIDDYKLGISEVQNSVYKVQEYAIPKPTHESVRIELQEQAEKEISTFKFWKKNQMIEEYVNERQREALANKMIEWKKEKDKFDSIEEEKVFQYREESQQKYSQLIKLINNDEEAINESIDSWLKTIAFPFEFSIEYDIRGKDLWVDLDLPEIEDMPLHYAQRMANGTVKVKNRTKKDIKEDYFKCVLGLAIFFTSNLMSCAIGIERVIISAYTQRPDNKGVISDNYIYSVKFDRDKMTKINLDDDISTIFFSFENICEVKADKSFKTIVPFE